MTYMETINAALLKYVNELIGKNAVVAEFDETTYETSGCSCCGGTLISFYIKYKREGDKHWRFEDVTQDPIDFLVNTLYSYVD